MSCTRCGGELEPEDLRCALCGLATPVIEERRQVQQVSRCTECNAAVAYSVEHHNPACGFCGAVMKVEEPVDPVERPQARALLSVHVDQAKAALTKWLSTRGFFRPGNLAAAASVDSMHLLWWAAWSCEGSATVSWTADSNHGSGKSDWAPHSGQTEMALETVLVSASRGLRPEETRALSGSVRLHQLQPLAGSEHEVEQFDLQRSAARKTVLAAIESAAVAHVTARCVPGSRHRKVKVQPLLTGLSTTRVAIPAYVVAYRYNERLFRAVVHGQDVNCVVGESPLSWRRVVGVAALAVSLVALAVWLSMRQ